MELHSSSSTGRTASNYRAQMVFKGLENWLLEYGCEEPFFFFFGSARY